MPAVEGSPIDNMALLEARAGLKDITLKVKVGNGQHQILAAQRQLRFRNAAD